MGSSRSSISRSTGSRHPGTGFWLLFGAWAGVFIYLVAKAGSRLLASLNKRDKISHQFRELAAQDRAAWLSSLGTTKEERTSTINGIFDRKDKSLSVVQWCEFDEMAATQQGQTKVKSYLGFKINRNLAAMETREREFLRSVELLDVSTDGENAEWCDRMKFGLLWGNGKATVETFSYWMQKENGVKDGQTAVAWYASHRAARWTARSTRSSRTLRSWEVSSRPTIISPA